MTPVANVDMLEALSKVIVTLGRRRCPLCEGEPGPEAFPYRTMWRHRDFSYVKCTTCGATYVDPVPEPELLAEMYSRENYHDVHYAHAHAGGEYQRSAAVLRRFAGGRRRLLDFGCGNGSFLLAARHVGFDCVGVEYEASAIENAGRKAGVPVFDLETVRASGDRFEIVHLGDVLEHLVDPYGTMRMLSTLLAPDGLLYVEGPLQSNPSLVYVVSAWVKRARRLLGIDRPGRTPPTHLLLVGRSAQMTFFTRRLGLRPLHVEVYETGWPYRVVGRAPASIAQRLKQVLGDLAVLVSLLRVFGLGNRFRALLATGPEAPTR